MNPCSHTYNQLQWVLAGYNPTACPAGITIASQNNAGVTGFRALYTNTSTGQSYNFDILTGSGTLGCLPPGNYTLNISKPGNAILLLFGNGCQAVSGTSGYFANVTISASNDCKNVTIDYFD